MDVYGQGLRCGRICCLFSYDGRIPKLDVAGSIPVSRSMFSMTYRQLTSSPPLLNAVIFVTAFRNSLKMRRLRA